MLYHLNKKLLILTLLGCLLVLCSCLFAFQAQAGQFTVIINELSWAGSSYSANDEFIELKNVTDQEIDMSGWYFTKISGGEEKIMLEIPEDSVIEAGNFFIISNYGKEESVLNVEPDLIDSSVSLSNSSLQIILYNAQGELIDIAGNGNEPFAGDNEFKASMVRNLLIDGGDQQSSWSSSLIFENLDQDVLDFATPGAENFLEVEIIDTEEFASEDTVIIEDGTASGDEVITVQPLVSDDEIIIDDNFASDDQVIIEDEIESEDVAPEIIEESNASEDIVPNLEHDEQPDENIEEQKGKLIINEIAFKEEQDWVEVKVIKSGNFNGWMLFQGESLVFEINDKNYKEGDLILLNLEKNLTGTDNILVLRDIDYEIQDVIIWSNNDGKFTKSKNQAGFLIESSHWMTNKDFNEDDSGAWVTSNDIEKGMSLARISDLDTNSPNDWRFTYKPTGGFENEIVLSQIIEQEPELAVVNEIEQQIKVEDEIEITESINLSGKLIINEILSQPFPGQTEWVEIYNSSDEDIEVTDCYLQEGRGSKFYLKGVIPAKFYMIVKTKNLNNSGDIIELYSKDKQLLDQVIYGELENSMIGFEQKQIVLPYALVKDSTGFWKLTTLPTPGSENIVQEIVEEKKEVKAETNKTSKSSTAKKSTSKKLVTTKTYINLNSTNINAFKDNDLVSFEGVITVDPGRFLKQRMYMQNEELGIEVYFHKADWPNLEIGQKVQVKGRYATKEISQIKISSKEDIIIKGQGEAELKELSVGNQNHLIGFLAATDGEVSERLTSGFNLVTEEGDIQVCFRKNAGLNVSDLENGQRVFINGILLPYKESFCLYPRINEDISVLPSEVELGAVQTEVLPEKKSLPVKIILMIAGGILSAGLGLLYFIQKGKLKILGLAKN